MTDRSSVYRSSVHLDAQRLRYASTEAATASKVPQAMKPSPLPSLSSRFRGRPSAQFAKTMKEEGTPGDCRARATPSSWLSSFLGRYWLALAISIFIVVDKTELVVIDWASLLRSYPKISRRVSDFACNLPATASVGGVEWKKEWNHWKLQHDGSIAGYSIPSLPALAEGGKNPTLISSRWLASKSGLSRALNSDGSSSASSQGASSHSNTDSHAGPQDALFYLIGTILTGAFVTHMTSFPIFQGIQESVVMFVLGACLALFIDGLKLAEQTGVFGRSFNMWMEIDPHLLLFVLIPPLVTGDAMTIDTTIAKRVMKQCLWLAGPGVAIAGCSTAGFLYFYLPYEWPFLLCMTLGSILCATDPVAVVALLKELGAPPSLTVQIQGESLINDGTSIVLYTIAYNMLKGEKYDMGDIIAFLVKMGIYAWGLGMFLGFVFYSWIKGANNKLHRSSSVIQIALTITCAYSSFIIAEGIFHISGVLSTVAAALVLAHKMWPNVTDKVSMHMVWHIFEYLGNTIIFFLAGSLSGSVMAKIGWEDYVHLLVIYAALIVIRGALIFCSIPLLKYLHADKQPVTFAEAAVMTWGGLRGAIGLALAIQVSSERAGGSIDRADADRVLFFTSGIAALTLVVNATTCPLLVKHLGVTQMGSTKRKMISIVTSQMRDIVQRETQPGRVREAMHFILNEVDQEIVNPKSRAEQALDLSESQVHKIRCAMSAADGKQHRTFKHVQMLEASKNQEGPYQEPVSYLERQVTMRGEDGASPMQWSSAGSVKKSGAGKERKSATWQGKSTTQTDGMSRTGSLNGKGTEARSWMRMRTSIDKSAESDRIKRLLEDHENHLKAYNELRRGSKRAAIPSLPLKDQRVFMREILEEFGIGDYPVLRAVNEAMLAAVLAQYWNMIQGGHFFANEAEQVLASVSIAHGNSHYDLLDFSFIEPFVKTSFEDSQGRLSNIAPDRESMGDFILGSQRPSLVQRISMSVKEESSLHKFLAAAPFTGIIAMAIIGNAITTQIEQEVSDEKSGESVGWLIPELGFNVIFFLEFVLKFADEKLRYFRNASNVFDFTLVILGVMGCCFSMMAMTNSSGGAGDDVPASETRMVRVAQIFRMMRLVRVFRIYRLFRQVLNKLAHKTTHEELAEAMLKVQILKCFVRAHMKSQEKMVRYFGFHGKVDRPEVAHMLLQSEVSVFKAICLCEKQKETIDEVLVKEVRNSERSKATVSAMEDFIREAHKNGVLNSVEVESMVHPLHHHLSKLNHELRDIHSGRINLDELAEHQEEDNRYGEQDRQGATVDENDYIIDYMGRSCDVDDSDSEPETQVDGTRSAGSFDSNVQEHRRYHSETENSVIQPPPAVMGKRDLFQEPAQEPAPEYDDGTGSRATDDGTSSKGMRVLRKMRTKERLRTDPDRLSCCAEAAEDSQLLVGTQNRGGDSFDDPKQGQMGSKRYSNNPPRALGPGSPFE